MQKLGLTVKQLVDDLAPFAAEDPPVVYTGAKSNALFTVDVRTGQFTSTFNTFGSTVIDDDMCRQEDDLESFDGATCSARGTFILGRNDYTVGIQNSLTGEPICTIKYSEWVPNNRDKDLHNQYATTKDNRYIYSLFDGRIVALDHPEGTAPEQKPRYQQKLESPVVRVFDVARPTESSTANAPLIILPQPIGPSSSEGQIPGDQGRVFVNCTETGSWYALSETKYPLVTYGALMAPVVNEDWIYNLPRLEGTLEEQLKKNLIGVHALSYAEALPKEIPLIAGPPEVLKSISDRPAFDNRRDSIGLVPSGLPQSNDYNIVQMLSGLAVIFLLSIFGLMAFTDRGFARRKLKQYIQPVVDFTSDEVMNIKPQVEIKVEAQPESTTLVEPLLVTLPDLAAEAEDSEVINEEDFVTATIEAVEPPENNKENIQANATELQNDETVPKSRPEDTLPGPDVSIPAITISSEFVKGPKHDLELQTEVPIPATEVAAPLEEKVEEVVMVKEVDPETVPIIPSPETPTPKPKGRKAHRGKRGGKRLKEGQEDENVDDVEAIGEGVTKVDGVVAVTPQAVYETDGRTNLNGLVFDENGPPIGSGSGGTLVYAGDWEGRPVAVKRMQHVHYELAMQEIDILGHSEEHPNVIRYKCTRQNKDFLYIGLELCQGSLFDLWGNGPMSPPPDSRYAGLAGDVSKEAPKALRQLAEGMKYLHSFRIVHRDIKPQNILIAYAKNFSTTTYPRLVISDFGLCKVLPNDTSTLLGATVAAAGTHGWKAPELISQPVMSGSQNSASNSSLSGADGAPLGVRRACDIFSLGCVFFYVLTHGLHPFEDKEGWTGLRERNIKLNRYDFSPIEMYGPDTIDLIGWMLSPRPEDRPTAAQVLAHPFFWNAEDRLEFLSLASDRFDQETRDGTSDVLDALEGRAEEIIPRAPNVVTWSSIAQHKHLPNGQSGAGAPAPPPPEHNFLAILDRKFTDTLGKQRKYNGAKLADLLRALRNKHHHWDDMPDDVKAKVGEVPEGYLAYWEGKFPALVVGVWRVLREVGIAQERRFGRWFSGRGG